MGKVYLYPQKNGKVKAQWRDPRNSGRQHSRTFNTLAEAEDFKTVTEASMITGTYRDISRGKIKFGEYWNEHFVPRKRLGKKAMANYLRYGRVNLLPYFEQVPLNQISAEAAIEWGHWAHEEQGFGPATVKEAFVVLRSAMTFARKKGFVHENNLSNILSEVVPELNPPREKIILTPEQVLQLSELIDPRWKAMVLTMGWVGLRPGEAIGLRLGDVSLLDGTITVRRSVVNVEGRMIENKSTKTKKTRVVKLPEPLIEALADHMQDFLDDPTDEGALLFPTVRTNSFVHTDQLRRYVKKAASRMDIEMTTYDLRHSAATNALHASNNDAAWVASMLGHGVDTLLKVYSHNTNESAATNLDKLTALFAN